MQCAEVIVASPWVNLSCNHPNQITSLTTVSVGYAARVPTSSLFRYASRVPYESASLAAYRGWTETRLVDGA